MTKEYDETALLAFSILMEEQIKEMLEYQGCKMFVHTSKCDI